MKKIYQMPVIRWVEAQTEQMIAASNPEDGFKQSEAPETTATEGNLSRHFSGWGDDEE
jgi:hypothetical protein